MTRSKLRMSLGTSSETCRPGVAGQIGGTLFFLVWLAIPTIMLVVILRDTWLNARTLSWPAVECTILRSGVEQTGSDGDYAFRVEYAYTAGRSGDLEPRRMTSTVYTRGYRGSGDYAEPQRLALQYPPGGKAICYVNPANPSDAVLKRKGLVVGAMALFPLLFIAIGAGGLWFTWRGGAGTGVGAGAMSNTAAPVSTPLSKQAGAKASPWLLVLFFAAFTGCGGIILVAMGRSALNVFSAKSWNAVPATVVSSRVRSHSGDDGTTYSVDVLYRYSAGGREYHSNRYGFMGGSSSGYDGKRKVVDRLRPGTPVTAYVNPADPTDAVLERGFTWNMLFMLIPAAFLAIGVGGIVYATRRALRIRSEDPVPGGAAGPRVGAVSPFSPPGDRSARAFTPRRTLHDDGSPVALKPRQSPVVKLIGITIAALFWNGIVSVFLFQVVKSWSRGRGEVCLTIFLVPFVLVGIALVVAIFHSLLALFNPRVVLVLGRGALALGESADLRWSVAGRADRINRLVLRLEGREEATYRQGTDTHTDKNTFFSLDLLDTTNPGEIREGRSDVSVPVDSMHSFAAANNKIVWVLTVHGHIQGWPDVKDEYVVSVGPRPRRPAAMAEPEIEQPEATWNA